MTMYDLEAELFKRTKTNLEAIERLKAEGEEVYETTQLINSLLSLLIFPREIFFKNIPEIPFEKLVQDGIPVPTINKGETPNLRILVRKLRNSVAHFNLSMKGKTDITHICFQDKREDNVTWDCTFNIQCLKEFVFLLEQLIESNNSYQK